MYLTDYHTHTALSFDGQATLAQMAQAALDAGVDELCVTDHCDLLDEAGRAVPAYSWDKALAQYRETLSLYQGRLTLKLGLELGMPHVDPAAAQAIWAQPEADFILGSVHNLSPAQGGKDFYYEDLSDPAVCAAVLDDYFYSLQALARTDFYDVLAHIIYPLRYMTAQIRLDPWLDAVRAILRTAVEKGRGIELNTCRGRTLTEWRPVLALYREAGGEILTLGSDAHSPDAVGKGLREAQALLKDMGFRYFCTYEKHTPHFHLL